MIYFIQAVQYEYDRNRGGAGPIKIGYTDDPNLQDRFSGIQTGNPYPLRVLGVIASGTYRSEGLIHQKFSSTRMRGEWFKCTDTLRTFIEKYSTGYTWGPALKE
jgi:Meiotically Up-regulated Gene 113 (MUG113) protein